MPPAGVIASAPRYSNALPASGSTMNGATAAQFAHKKASTVHPSPTAYAPRYSNAAAPASTSAASGFSYSQYSWESGRQSTGASSGGAYNRGMAYTNTARGTSRTGSLTAGRTTRRTITPSSATRKTETEAEAAANKAYTQRAPSYASNSWLHRASNLPVRARQSTATEYQAPQQVQRQRSTRVTLVLDLDETLVHSSFEPVEADLHIPVAMDGELYMAYVKKRPFMEEFLRYVVQHFDVVVWTASLSVYAEPLIDELCELSGIPTLKKMYREACTQLPQGGYVKDLTTMGRRMEDICILDNSPSVAQLQPKNLIPIVSWYDDMSDTCLRDLIPHLDRLAKTMHVHDVIPTLPGAREQW